MRDNFNTIFLLVLLAVVGYLSYVIFSPFLVAIFLAFIFSHLFRNWYKKSLKIFANQKSLASFATCLLIFLILIIPLILVGMLVISEINQTYQMFKGSNWNISLDNIPNIPFWDAIGFDKSIVESFLHSGQLAEGLQKVSGFFFQVAKTTYQGASGFIFMLLLLFYSLYYLFKDQDKLEKKLFNLSPLKNSQEKRLIEQFISVSNATLKGNLVVAIVQGVVQGIALWIAGVPSSAFLGLLTALLSLIPLLGAPLVWVPAGIILLAVGHIWEGIFVLATGGLIVSTIDNLLRPKLVEGQTSLHPLLVFFSTFGGIIVFGFVGFILGPVIVVLFLTLLDIYRLEFKKELKKFNK